MILVNPDLVGECRDLYAPLASRVATFNREFCEEVDPDEVTRAFLARAVVRDPSFRLHAITESGQLIGFVISGVEQTGSKRWIFTQAAWIDNNVDAGDAIYQVHADLAQWARSLGLSKHLMATTRDRAFARKYGWKPSRVVMTRDVG